MYKNLIINTLKTSSQNLAPHQVPSFVITQTQGITHVVANNIGPHSILTENKSVRGRLGKGDDGWKAQTAGSSNKSFYGNEKDDSCMIICRYDGDRKNPAIT